MREADWTSAVPGLYGALMIAEALPETKTELKAFIGSLNTGEMTKGIQFLLRKTGMLETK
jgi:hypothetical protein